MKLIFRYLVMLAMITFFIGCSFGHQSPRYIKLAHQITDKTAKKLKEQKGLFLIGTGGQMMDDIQAMDMSFHFYHEVDLKTARELIVYVVNEYLTEINNNKEIRPYLHEYPFTAKNVEIRIWIYQTDGSYPPLEKIQCMSSINGILKYYQNVPEKYTYHPIREETYEEALQAISSK